MGARGVRPRTSGSSARCETSSTRAHRHTIPIRGPGARRRRRMPPPPRSGSSLTSLPKDRAHTPWRQTHRAALLLDALRGFAIRSELSGALKLEARRVTVVDTDARLEVLAAGGASAHGLRPGLRVVGPLL